MLMYLGAIGVMGGLLTRATPFEPTIVDAYISSCPPSILLSWGLYSVKPCPGFFQSVFALQCLQSHLLQLLRRG